jgi:hypothetical protein
MLNNYRDDDDFKLDNDIKLDNDKWGRQEKKMMM